MDGQPTSNAGMEGGEAQSTPSLPSDLNSAAQQVIDAGGLKGGRPREDGLVPGSPEAVAADKEKDAKRKRDQRAARKNGGPAPAALPSALDAAPVDTPKADVAAVPVVLWKPGNLVRAFKTVIPGIEDWTQQLLVSKASKIPGMHPGMLAEIEADCVWEPDAKDALVNSGAALAAKYLNKAGVSSEYGPEVDFASAVLSVGAGYLTLSAKLDKWARDGFPGQSSKPVVQPKAES